MSTAAAAGPQDTDNRRPHSASQSVGLDHRMILAALGALFLVRLLFIFWLPFTDTTEARYAEIARKMVETNNWITPQFDYGVPFWGKPPLHTWLSAIGMKLFGVGPFGARALIFVSALGVLTTVFAWAQLKADRTVALVAVLVCATSVMFFGASAFVMTDIPMVLGTTLSMAGFFVAATTTAPNRLWGYLFFVGLAVGMLAKGPTAIVLTGIPIFLWLLIGNRWYHLARLPWVGGLILAFLLTTPWYAAAEISTPGFLRYFIVGEHFERFLVPGWQGDLYGSGHKQPKGMIWLFAMGVFLPWSVFMVAQCARAKAAMSAMPTANDGRISYLLLWIVSPMLLFTPAANILPAYVLPAVPAFSFLVATVVVSSVRSGSRATFYGFWTCVMVSVVFFATVTALSRISPETLGARTMKGLVEEIRLQAPQASISTFPGRIYSAEFYTRGGASAVSTVDQLDALKSDSKSDAVIVANSALDAARDMLGDAFSEIGTYRNHTVLLEVSR